MYIIVYYHPTNRAVHLVGQLVYIFPNQKPPKISTTAHNNRTTGNSSRPRKIEKPDLSAQNKILGIYRY